MRWGWGVLVLFLGGAAQAEQVIDYRNRVITMGGSPRASACLAVVKRGIDMVETLPPKLKSLGQKVKSLRCDPLPADAPHTRAEDNVTGIYVMESRDEARGHILFRRDPNYLEASNIAVSLVGNGIYAQRHSDLIEGKRQLAKSPNPALQAKVDRLQKIVSKSDMDLTVKAECELLDAQYGTLKALGADPRDLSGLSKFMLRRGCE